MNHTIICAVLTLMLFGAALQAQPMRMGKDESPQGLERVERWKKVRLMEILDLKEEQSVRFMARFNDHEQAMRDLARQKDEMLDKLERLVRNRADDADIERSFPELFALNRKIDEHREDFVKSLSDILSVEQRAKLLLFERHFERELREAMRDVARRRHGIGEP